MRRVILGMIGAVVSSLSVQASAADLPARTYPAAPAAVAPSPIYDWSGFYIGINGGGGSAHNCWSLVSDAFGDLPGNEGCHNATGGTVGGQIGYRWQSANWVFGVEGQGNWANFKGNNVSLLFGPDSNQSRVDGFGLITGQVGYALDNVLFYVKGGAAVTGNKYDAISGSDGSTLGSASETRWGGAIGAGAEFGFTPNWSVGVEYNHLFMGTRSVNLTDPTGAVLETESIRQDVDIGLVRLNYRFGGWGAPITARY
ncbi:MAG: outer membrane beta-barrel protein [Bradyrhizobium sp.]|nr:outer membrane beta-barrel protein [Bradyrhizobium sp.]